MIEFVESKDIKANTFSLRHFVKLAPAFLGTLINPLYFNIVVILFVVLVVHSIFDKTIKFQEIVIVLLWLCYLFMYSMHYRGYFFVEKNSASVFDTFRYLNNFYCLIPIVLSQLLNNKFPKSILFVVLASSLFTTFQHRKDFFEIEQENRFLAPKKVLSALKQVCMDERNFIISSDILVYQNLGDDNLNVCDLVRINEMQNFIGENNVFLILCDYEITYYKKRYGININLSEWKLYDVIDNNRCIYVLSNK